MTTPPRTKPTTAPIPEGRLVMDGFARWILSAVEPQPERVPYIRAQARRVLQLWQIDDALAWPVQLLLTELATNAVRHARTLFTVMLTWDGTVLRAEVADVNPVPPRLRHNVSPEALGGRGLMLVQELSSAWGVHTSKYGKTVWFTITHA